MKQQSSTSLGGKRSEDKQEEGCEFLGTPKCKKRHEVTREKKKPRRDEGQTLKRRKKGREELKNV